MESIHIRSIVYIRIIHVHTYNITVLYLEISSRGGGKIKVSRNKGGKPSWMQNLLSDLVFQGE